MKVLYEDEIPGAKHWSLLMRKGTVLTLIDKQGGANVGMLFYNPSNYLERYNAPDTLKCQHTFKLTKGNCLYSDMGRIFCSIIEDSLGWHDTVGGNSHKQLVKQKWGEHNYQDYRNECYRNGYDSFLVELAKYGMTDRDMASNLNLFSKIYTDESGNMMFQDNHSQAGDSISLRFEMDTLVLFHTCPHPMNTSENYPMNPIIYQISKAEPLSEDDVCLNYCDENQRGFKNNDLYHIAYSG
ncbi:MAG: urea carboxylase-associated family protein [Gammaproteobacteria bacterium]|nr:urea carboxylase-associated family protein [Gammaproteobacteria bacterium]